MKKIILMFICLAAISAANAQRKSVKVPDAGKLASVISEKEKMTITDLKVIGDLNGSDILLLRQMAGSDSKGNPQKGHLANLDLSDANILKGGNSYYSLASAGEDACTENDQLSANFFSGCLSLKSVVIPNTVTFISNNAFSFCPSLVEIKTANSKFFSSADGILYSADHTLLIRCPQGKKVTKVSVPEGVKQIYPSAFRGVKSLTEIEFPSTLEGISDVSFLGCPNITTIKCNATNPPAMEEAFDASVIEKANVIVRTATAEKYQSVDGWSSFKNIVER